jgi:hypothetical protein
MREFLILMSWKTSDDAAGGWASRFDFV